MAGTNTAQKATIPANVASAGQRGRKEARIAAYLSEPSLTASRPRFYDRGAE